MELGIELKPSEKLSSIVLPVYNQVHMIEDALLSLLAQTYPNKELIVIDDGSTDGTTDVLRRLAKVYNFKLVEMEHRGRSAARNEGLKLASGSFVFFAEGDATYDSYYLSKCIEKLLEKERVAGVIGKMLIRDDGRLLTKCLQTEREIVLSNYKPKSAWVYKKEVLEEIGGFDEGLSAAEEVDLAIRIKQAGYSIEFVEEALWWHEPPKSLLRLLVRSFDHERRRLRFYKKYPRYSLQSVVFHALTLVYIIFSLMLLFVDPLLLLAALVLPFVVNALRLLTIGWGKVSRRRYLIPLACIGVLKRVFSSLGFLYAFLRTKH